MQDRRYWPLLLLLLAGCPAPVTGPGADAAGTAMDSASPVVDAAARDAAVDDDGAAADAPDRDAEVVDAIRPDQPGDDLAPRPEAGGSDVVIADTGLPDLANDDVQTTDAATADASVPDAAARDVLAADAPGADATAADASAPEAGPFVVRGASHSYHVTVTVTVHNTNAALTRLSVVLPAPRSNDYQDVANLDVGAAALRAIPETDDRYALFTATSGLPAAGHSASYAISYDVTLFALHSDLARVSAIAPYDTGSDLYRWYTGASGVYVVPANATIQALSSTLWAAHPDLLGYARAAYEHVAASYDYLDPYSGLHPLADILAAGGGDCGNLSSIYVSLLRARDIPARHLVTVRPDGSAHVWADFYLQDHGWVPVDVTAKQANPGGDYFGQVALASNGIIQDKEVALSIDHGAGTVPLSMLQTYAWWYWSSTPSPVVTSAYSIAAVPR